MTTQTPLEKRILNLIERFNKNEERIFSFNELSTEMRNKLCKNNLLLLYSKERKIYISDKSSNEEIEFGEGFYPQWSPRGNLVIYHAPGYDTIQIRSLDGKINREIALERWASHHVEKSRFTISNDDRFIAYYDEDQIQVEQIDTGEKLFRTKIDHWGSHAWFDEYYGVFPNQSLGEKNLLIHNRKIGIDTLALANLSERTGLINIFEIKNGEIKKYVCREGHLYNHYEMYALTIERGYKKKFWSRHEEQTEYVELYHCEFELEDRKVLGKNHVETNLIFKKELPKYSQLELEMHGSEIEFQINDKWYRYDKFKHKCTFLYKDKDRYNADNETNYTVTKDKEKRFNLSWRPR